MDNGDEIAFFFDHFATGIVLEAMAKWLIAND
jgi:hypothetical protein